MHVALLCPGPSLAHWLTRLRAHDMRIGVNRSATAIECDWWAASDLPLIKDECGNVKGSPNLLTRRATAESLYRRGDPYRPWAGVARHTESLTCPVPGWGLYTACAALVLAHDLGATRIDVYGADWTDAPDFDGYRDPSANRRETRWERERVVWRQVCDWLKCGDHARNRCEVTRWLT